ncbi:MAG: hypothetical protein HYS65_00040 [Betaproteobacteria bacterium]|nr:hypothetical protein [Betaproteobacteria bacterium]MBI3056633.1 hypothetical protein [Betaproteobacteria bacterium]
MYKFWIVLMATAGAMAATPVLSATMSKDAHKAALQRIDDAFKSDKEQCKPLKANSKDICIAEAKARRKIAKADQEANYLGTVKARTAARVARADAEYLVAKEKCDDLAGNGKDVCLKEAKAALVSAKADAKADRKVSKARRDADKVSTEARRDASEDKRDAEYRVAVERCDAYSGNAKSRCVKDARLRFGKT